MKKTQFAENIAKRRKSLGMNQDDLAARVGVHVNTIKNMERGLSEGHPDTRQAIAKALDCELWQLLGGPMAHQNETPAPSGRSDLILAIQARLTALDERELRLILGFLDDLDSHRTVETSPTVRAK